jgi:hypothetical protein
VEVREAISLAVKGGIWVEVSEVISLVAKDGIWVEAREAILPEVRDICGVC